MSPIPDSMPQGPCPACRGITLRGIEKRRIVDDGKDRERFVARIEEAVSAVGTVIYAWLHSTNHAHILLRSGPKGLPAFMRSAGGLWSVCRGGNSFG
jgi:hypothetical protein